MSRRRSAAVLAGLVLLASAVVACGGRSPVGELALSATAVELPYPSRSEMVLSWMPRRTLANLREPLRVFVHVRDADGAILRTFDHDFPSNWEPGQSVQYRLSLFQSALGPSLAPGRYELTLGLYDLAGNRWALATDAPEVARNEYRFAELQVPRSDFRVPALRFIGAWGPLERGEGFQIMGRRSLVGAGELVLAGVSGAGELWLRLVIPSATGALQEVLYTGDDEQLAVHVGTDCGRAEHHVSGSGVHEIVLPLESPPGQREDPVCQVRFAPAFEIIDLDTLSRRVLQIEALTWSPSAPLELEEPAEEGDR